MNYLKEFKVGQSAQKDPNRNDFYEWEIWIENGDRDISEIDYVQYLLHSTFRNRLRTGKALTESFKIKSSGWGEFSIGISIFLKSGEQIQTSHWLQLGDDVHTASVKEDFDEQQTAVYLSYSDANAKEAKTLSTMLLDLGMDVVSTIDIDPGVAVEEFIMSSIAATDAVITINYDESNNWQKAEVELAHDLSKKVISIEDIIGSKDAVKLKKSGGSILDRSYESDLRALGSQIKKIKF